VDATGCTILLVDDEGANLDLLELVLRPKGYRRLVRVQDAREAVAAFERARPDLVLLDLHMPHRDGFEVLADLRARVPAGEYLPVLVLTADATARARERALAGGAHDYVLKPFDRAEVLLRVRNLLETRLLHLAARDAAAAREQVLAIVAHDLRAPLTAVRFDVEMLRVEPAGALAAQDARTLARIERAVVRMDDLIEDLLDVSRLNRGALPLDRRPHDVGALLAEAAATLRPLVEGHGLRFEVHAAAAAPTLDVDGTRVLQAVSNLVGNAAKFAAHEGRVALAWDVVDDGAGRALRVAVSDDGPGIAPEELPHVFGAFWQARHADRRGLGLGLAIARGIVEAHGGSIWAESNLGRGTTFVFSLPLGEAP
jgi:signal transduction histidine kinase